MRRLTTSIVLLVVLVGCGDMKAVLSLVDALRAEYHVPANVSINNGTHLIISFQNLDQSMKWDSAGKAEFAHKVAVFARKHYAAVNHLDDISVRFVSVSQVGPLSMTRSDAPFTFPVDSLH